jgi:hypothetical protein
VEETEKLTVTHQYESHLITGLNTQSSAEFFPFQKIYQIRDIEQLAILTLIPKSPRYEVIQFHGKAWLQPVDIESGLTGEGSGKDIYEGLLSGLLRPPAKKASGGQLAAQEEQHAGSGSDDQIEITGKMAVVQLSQHFNPIHTVGIDPPLLPIFL